MLKIWGRKSSSNVQAVMWAVGELGLEYERIDAGLHYGLLDTPEFAAMNPNRTVPVLRDGDGPALWESGAILRYLGRVYGGDSLWPRDLWARTEADRWAEWAKINLALTFTGPVFWPMVRVAPSKRDPAAVTRGLATFEAKLAIAEAQLARQPYLAGADFTLADIQIGSVLYRYYDLDLARGDFPAVAAYYDRLTARPAYREHVMISYEELRARD